MTRNEAVRHVATQVQSLVSSVEQRIVGYRRDFHRYAESGWTEFRTASLIARRLSDLGYEVQVGRDVMVEADRMGVPDQGALESCWQRAVEEGGDRPYLEAMRGGYTGVVGALSNGDGPVVGLRFDIDALDIDESTSENHRPARDGFASVHSGVAHACGHDGHAAVGLGVAEVLIALGTEIPVPLIDEGKERVITIHEGIQPGEIIRLKGAGMPSLRRGRGHGDLFVQVRVKTPTKLNQRQRELLMEFAELDTHGNGPKARDFWDRIKGLKNSI